ncbi:C1 family peptidase, partial [Bacteroidota bacterium]
MKRIMMLLLATSFVFISIDLIGQSKNIFIVEKTEKTESAETLPTSFDLRSFDGVNYVTPIRHQTGGTCWAHGVMAAIEGSLLMDGSFNHLFKQSTPDLAEYHLDWWNGFNQFNNADLDPPTGDGFVVHNGGDYRVAAAYMTRGEGPVREEDVPNSYYVTPLRVSPDYELFYTRDIQWYTI